MRRGPEPPAPSGARNRLLPDGGESRLRAGFADGPAFVPYLVAGDPTVEASKAYLEALDRGGADVLELGLPFSEPMAEGPTIQTAIARALEAGMTPDRYFELAESLEVDAELVCMTYYNLVYQYGTEEGPAPFVERAADAGFAGFVIPDLPAEEADDLRAACDEFGLDLIFVVAPTTEAERLERIRELVSGYVYVQARLGTTGARADVSDRTGASLARIADWEVPKAVGFGISSGEHAERIVAAGADGIIVGSALVDVVAAGLDESVEGDPEVAVEETARRLEDLARELVAGTRRGAEARSTEGPPAGETKRPEPEGS